MILDTNAVSALFDGDPAIADVLDEAPTHELPAIVIGEYRYGLARSRHRRTLGALLDTLIRESVVLHIDRDTAEACAVVREKLRVAGKPLPENDVWIAALAIQHDLPVVTRDKHFDHVAGLRRRSW